MRVGKRTRAEKVGANRASVLAAARRVFLAKGYAGATLEGIAEEAGFSKGVVYSQFGGKADLFLALLDARIDERAAQNERIAMDAVADAGTEGGGGGRALVALLENFDRDLRVEGGWAQVLVEFRSVAARDPELNRRYAASHARMLDLLADLIERSYARAGIESDVAPRTLAELLGAVGAGVTLERAADPGALAWPALAQPMSRVLGLDLEAGVAATPSEEVV